MIDIKGSAVYNEHHELITKRTNKNVSSQRTIPILIPQLTEALNSVPDKSGRVVAANPSGIYKTINRIYANNNLPEVGIHGLRHSFASLAYHLNIPEKIAMEIGGWSDDATMKRIYTHIASKDVTHYGEQIKTFFNTIANPNANENK